MPHYPTAANGDGGHRKKALIICTNRAFISPEDAHKSANPTSMHSGGKPRHPASSRRTEQEEEEEMELAVSQHHPTHPHGQGGNGGKKKHGSQARYGRKKPHQVQQQEEERGEQNPAEYEEFTEEHDGGDLKQGKQYKFTGIDIVEVAHCWVALSHRYGLEVDIATPKGGPTAADPRSLEHLDREESHLRHALRQDRELTNLLGHTYPIEWVDPECYCCVIVPGAHGALLDLPQCRKVSQVIRQVYEQGGIVAAIGHGTAALINVKITPQPHPHQPHQQRGQEQAQHYLVKGKRVVCFSDPEEHAVKFADTVPYSLEQKLRERGAHLENEQQPFASKVVQDERVITGQNAQSSRQFAEQIVHALQKHHPSQQQ